jgi:hypothetical protein
MRVGQSSRAKTKLENQMPKFLVAIQHPENYDGSQEGVDMMRAIDDLNDEMVAAGIRIFVGGLGSNKGAKSLRAGANGNIHVTNGPYLETEEHVGGLWVLEAPNMDVALDWGRKAVIACRVPVEVRQFL